jgi:hypothetical protein
MLLPESELLDELAPKLCPPVLDAGRCRVGWLEGAALMDVELIAEGRSASGALVDVRGREGEGWVKEGMRANEGEKRVAGRAGVRTARAVG